MTSISLGGHAVPIIVRATGRPIMAGGVSIGVPFIQPLESDSTDGIAGTRSKITVGGS